MSSRTQPIKVIIMGAAGRDFHDFNVFWRKDPRYQVVAFTAAQIPDIEGRVYPAELCGERYPEGIPIELEDRLADLIAQHQVDQVALAYSDLSYDEVMHKASVVHAAGADFRLLGPRNTMLTAQTPVIAVCAVRTGCGKSQTSRAVTGILKATGRRVAAVRHPMPYGNLTKQICQRFASFEDLERYECTIEEREEYEPHVRAGNVVFAGIDYEKILHQAQSEADVILWDGGNNDLPFYKPTLHIVVADPHRPGHELRYYPGETNARLADVVVINKVGTARPQAVQTVEENIRRMNPRARIIRAMSPLTVDDPAAIAGKRVLVVEDGPTVTHGEMSYGAGWIAARDHGAAQIVDPRPFALGSIRQAFEKYTQLTEVLPAMGYGRRQMAELQDTINAADADLVVIGTPIDLGRLLQINKPAIHVRYELDPGAVEMLREEVERALGVAGRSADE